MNANSRAAYRKIGMFIDGHHMSIYETLLAKGPQTPWDISYNSYFESLPLEADQVFRRMLELEKLGYVQRLDWVANSPSGRACSVWWVK